MIRLGSSNIFIFILFLFLIACHTDVQKANARTSNSHFREAPIKSEPMVLLYDTSTNDKQDIINQLDKFYHTQVVAGFNGSVLIGYKGRIIYERYFGVCNRETRTPLNKNSSSQLASVSKTFTGAAILYLHEHKYIDIDQPVQTYIKNFPYQHITVRTLLNHRSGLPDYTKWIPLHDNDFDTPINNDTMLAMMAKYKPALEFTPNKKFRYSNTNFAVLASIIEKVTEMHYSDFMFTYIFQPLGMNHTFIYNPSTGLPIEATQNYDRRWKRVPDMFADGVYGDKGIFSTPEDMFRWDQSFYQKKILSNETIEMAYGPCSFEKPGIKNYGLGWRMLCYANGNKVIYHNGWWHGNNTSFYRFIKDNMTIIVLGNKFSTNIYRQPPVIYSIVKGVPVQKGFDTED